MLQIQFCPVLLRSADLVELGADGSNCGGEFTHRDYEVIHPSVQCVDPRVDRRSAGFHARFHRSDLLTQATDVGANLLTQATDVGGDLIT
jgi:hypothetical protein